MELKTILRSKKVTRQFIAKFYPITLWIGSDGRMLCCPFHSDSSPSARVFYDDDYPRLYCFSENKQYDSYDYIEKVLGIDPKEFLSSKLSENAEQLTAFASSFTPVLTTKKNSIAELLPKNQLDEVAGEAVTLEEAQILNRLYQCQSTNQ